MNCLACNRELKNITPDGLGAVCRRKNHVTGNAAAQAIRVELIGNRKNQRVYLVFTQPRRMVVVSINADGSKVANCAACNHGADACEHILAIVQTEKGK